MMHEVEPFSLHCVLWDAIAEAFFSKRNGHWAEVTHMLTLNKGGPLATNNKETCKGIALVVVLTLPQKRYLIF